MNCVINITTGEVVDGPANSPFERFSLQAGYRVVPAEGFIPPDRRKWRGNTARDGVELRPQAEIDAIDSNDAAVLARPANALAAIRNQLAALLGETDAGTMARTQAIANLAGVTQELGRIEVLLKRIVVILRQGIIEDVQ